MKDDTFTDVVETYFRKPGVYEIILEKAYDGGRYRTIEVVEDYIEFVEKWRTIDSGAKPTGMFDELLFQAIEKIDWIKLAGIFMDEAFEVYGDDDDKGILSALIEKQVKYNA